MGHIRLKVLPGDGHPMSISAPGSPRFRFSPFDGRREASSGTAFSPHERLHGVPPPEPPYRISRRSTAVQRPVALSRVKRLPSSLQGPSSDR